MMGGCALKAWAPTAGKPFRFYRYRSPDNLDGVLITWEGRGKGRRSGQIFGFQCKLTIVEQRNNPNWRHNIAQRLRREKHKLHLRLQDH